jgi:two-component system, NtrC family, response regulator GlrR
VSSASEQRDRERNEPRASSDTTVEDGCAACPPAEPHHALTLLFGRVHGTRRCFELCSDPLHLGREVDEPHVRLDDPRASRRHAEIHWSEMHRRHWIRDLGSRNGIHLNGIKVAREQLKPGDVLRVGDTLFRFGDAEPELSRPEPIEPSVVGASWSLRRTFTRARQIAASDAPVLVLGATGTGKELVARAIHQASTRTGPLVSVNCAALPAHLVESELFGHEKGAFSGAESARPGLFRATQGGTLFLDEVGELPPDVQAKLLRAIESGSIRPVGGTAELPVNVRIVAATNRDLAGEVRSGGFRCDLYARLAELVIQLDPLRERPEDLEPLWRHFVSELGQGATIELSGPAFEAMALYAWPFNVRELRQLVRSALLAMPEGGELGVHDLPSAMRPEPAAGPVEAARSPPLLLAPGEVPSKRQLLRLVEEFHGNVKDVAAFLRKDRKQVYRWLRRDHIDPDVYRRGNP